LIRTPSWEDGMEGTKTSTPRPREGEILNYNDMTRLVAGRTTLTKRRSDEVLVATLTVLSEVISAEETKDLLAQLPKSVRERVPVSGESIEMRPIEFVARVADLVQPATVDESEGYVRAVFATLGEAVNAGEMRDIADELGDEFADLLDRPVSRPEPRVPEAAQGSEPSLVRVLEGALGAVIRVPGVVLGHVVRMLPARTRSGDPIG
jgi:uncharacterized protein (DUF2267 family)